MVSFTSSSQATGNSVLRHSVMPAVTSTAPSTFSTIFTNPARMELRVETTIPPRVMGYTFTFGIYSPWNCLTGTWFPVSGYGRCCPETGGDCDVYTTCKDGSILANDQFSSVCSGSSSQTVCVTGTIYESIGDSDPKLYVGCWPSWTGGNWKATRTVPPLPSDPAGVGTNSQSLPKGPIAAIVVGAIFGLFLAVLLGVFGARWYGRRKAAEAAAAAADAPPPPPPRTDSGSVGATFVNSPRQPSEKFDGVIIMDDASSQGKRDSIRAVSGSSVPSRSSRRSSETSSGGPLEMTGYQLDPHELGVLRSGESLGLGAAEGRDRPTTPYMDAEENMRRL